ncbi:formin FRM3 [Toxoplasma gondii ARI]|uniref:Formin FRM3 n=1 Tax=Toxoplasma gondii ARI TaxID=1074872 RepID=A0A139XY83_TOXGO|nr:formin FRM3 [Toxoplasma gondii ARI]
MPGAASELRSDSARSLSPPVSPSLSSFLASPAPTRVPCRPTSERDGREHTGVASARRSRTAKGQGPWNDEQARAPRGDNEGGSSTRRERQDGTPDTWRETSPPRSGTRLLSKPETPHRAQHVEQRGARASISGSRFPSPPSPAMKRSRLQRRGRKRIPGERHAEAGACRVSTSKSGEEPFRDSPAGTEGRQARREEERASRDKSEEGRGWGGDGDEAAGEAGLFGEASEEDEKAEANATSSQASRPSTRQGLKRSQSQAFCRPASLQKPRLQLRHPSASFEASVGGSSPVSSSPRTSSPEFPRSSEASSPGFLSSPVRPVISPSSLFSSSVRRSPHSVGDAESEGAVSPSGQAEAPSALETEFRKMRSPSFFRMTRRQSPSWDNFYALSPTGKRALSNAESQRGEDPRHLSRGNLSRLLSPWSRNSPHASEASKEASTAGAPKRPHGLKGLECLSGLEDPERQLSLPALHSRQSWRGSPSVSPARLRSSSPFSSSPLSKARELWRRLSSSRSGLEPDTKSGAQGTGPLDPVSDRKLKEGQLPPSAVHASPRDPAEKNTVSVVSPSFWSFSSPVSSRQGNPIASVCSSVGDSRLPEDLGRDASPESPFFMSVSAGGQTDRAMSGDKTSLSRSTLAYTTCVQSLGEESASEAKEETETASPEATGATLRRAPYETRRGVSSPSSLSAHSQAFVFTDKESFLRKSPIKADLGALPSLSPPYVSSRSVSSSASSRNRFVDVSPSLLRSLSPSPLHRARSVSSVSFPASSFLPSDLCSPQCSSQRQNASASGQDDLSEAGASQSPAGSAWRGAAVSEDFRLNDAVNKTLKEAKETKGQGDNATRLARLETAVRALWSLQGDEEALQVLSRHTSLFLAEKRQKETFEQTRRREETAPKPEAPRREGRKSSPLHLVDMASLFSEGTGDGRLSEETDKREESDEGDQRAFSFAFSPKNASVPAFFEEPSRCSSAPDAVLTPSRLSRRVDRRPGSPGAQAGRTGDRASGGVSRKPLSLFPLADLSPSTASQGDSRGSGLFSCSVLRTRTSASGLVSETGTEQAQGDTSPLGSALPPTRGVQGGGGGQSTVVSEGGAPGVEAEDAGERDVERRGNHGTKSAAARRVNEELRGGVSEGLQGEKEDEKHLEANDAEKDNIVEFVMSVVHRTMSKSRIPGEQEGDEAAAKEAKQKARLHSLLLQLESLSDTLKTALQEQEVKGACDGGEKSDADGSKAVREPQETDASRPAPVGDARTSEKAFPLSTCPATSCPASPLLSTAERAGEAQSSAQGLAEEKTEKGGVALASTVPSPAPKRLADASVQTEEVLNDSLGSSESPSSLSKSLSPAATSCPSSDAASGASGDSGASAAPKPSGKGKPPGRPPGESSSAHALGAKATPKEAATAPGKVAPGSKKGKPPGPPPGAPKAPASTPAQDAASKKGAPPGPPPGTGSTPGGKGLPPKKGGPPGGKGPPPGKGPPGKGPPGKGGPKAKGLAIFSGPQFLIPEKHVPKPPPGFKAATKLQWTPLSEDKVTGTVFEGLLDRYPLASPKLQGESEESFSASCVASGQPGEDAPTDGAICSAVTPEASIKEPKGEESPPHGVPGASEASAKKSVPGEGRTPSAASQSGQSAASAAPEAAKEAGKEAQSTGQCLFSSLSAEDLPREMMLDASEKRETAESLRREGDAAGAEGRSGDPFPSASQKRPFRYRLDFVQLFDLFYHDEKELQLKAKKSSGGTGAGEGGGPKKKSGVLDAKATQNVEICLKKYKLSTVEEFKALAAQIDDPTTLAIDLNLAENITLYWPEPSACEALKAKSPENALQLPLADQLYFTLLNQVALGSEKLNFFLQRRAVDEELESKREKLDKYCGAIELLAQTLESDAFKDILGLVVRLGNCVNRGSKEGFGFKLKDFVGQLAACTSKDRSTNLFRVIVQTVLEQNPSACDEMRALQDVDAAKAIDLKDLLQFGDIEKKLGAWAKQIGDRRSAFGGAADKMEKWIESREARLCELKKKAEDAETLQVRLRGLMGLTKADCVWPEPLRWFGQFYSHFEAIAKEYRGAKDRDRQKAEREAKKKNDVLRRATTIGAPAISSLSSEKPMQGVPLRPAGLDPSLARLSSATQSRFPGLLSPTGGGGGNFFSGVGASFHSSPPLQRFNTYANHSGGKTGGFRSPSPLSPGAAAKSVARVRRASEAGKSAEGQEAPAEAASSGLAEKAGEEEKQCGAEAGDDGEADENASGGQEDGAAAAPSLSPETDEGLRVEPESLLERADQREREDEGKQVDAEEDAANLMASVDEEGRGLAPRIMAAWAQARSPHLGRYQGCKRGGRGLGRFPGILRDKSKKISCDGADSSLLVPSLYQTRTAVGASGNSPLPSPRPSPTAATNASFTVRSLRDPSPLPVASGVSTLPTSSGVTTVPVPSDVSTSAEFMFPFAKARPKTGSRGRARCVEKHEQKSEDVHKVVGGSSAASFLVSAASSLGLEKTKRREDKTETVQKARAGDKATAVVPRNKAALCVSPVPTTSPHGCSRPFTRSTRVSGGELSEPSGSVPCLSEADKEWVRCGGGYCEVSLSSTAGPSGARQQRDSRGSTAASHSFSLSGAGSSRASSGRQGSVGAEAKDGSEGLTNSTRVGRRRSQGAIGAEETEKGKTGVEKGLKMLGKGLSAGKFQSTPEHQAPPPLEDLAFARDSLETPAEAGLDALVREVKAVDLARKRLEAARNRDGETDVSARDRKESHPCPFSPQAGRSGLDIGGKDFDRSMVGDSVRKVRTRVTGGRDGSIERQATNPYIAANVPRHPRRWEPGGRMTQGRKVPADLSALGSDLNPPSAHGSGSPSEAAISDGGEVARQTKGGGESADAAV